MSKKEENRLHFAVYISPELKAEFKAYCKAHGFRLSDLVRKIIRVFLDNAKELEKNN